MSDYQLSTKEKKNIVDTQTYSKNGYWFDYYEVYRWGHVSFTEEACEEAEFDIESIDLSNPDGFDVGSVPFEERDFSDCVENGYKFSDNFPEDQKDRIISLLEERGINELSELLYKEGWSDDYETMFYGPLELIEP